MVLYGSVVNCFILPLGLNLHRVHQTGFGTRVQKGNNLVKEVKTEGTGKRVCICATM